METITETPAGLIHGMTAATYHADPAPTPSLSSTTARTLLFKSPAHAAREHPKLGGARSEETASMSTGVRADPLIRRLLECAEVVKFEG